MEGAKKIGGLRRAPILQQADAFSASAASISDRQALSCVAMVARRNLSGVCGRLLGGLALLTLAVCRLRHGLSPR